MLRSRSTLFLVILTPAAFLIAAVFPDVSAPVANISGSIVPGTSMLSPRSGHSSTLLPDGRVLIAGGMRRNQDFYRSAELFDPSAGRFLPTGEMSTDRVGQAAVLLRTGKVLVAGGWTREGVTDSAELYDPKAGRFVPLPARMTVRRAHPSVTELPDGNILLIGGASRDGMGGSLASAEIFDVGKQIFRPAGTMRFGRISHTATMLKDGRILIAGGRGDGLVAVAELYDPKTRAFREAGRIINPRYKHTSALLPDGRVLIAGGSDERDWRGNLASAEIFDPRTGSFTSAPDMSNKRFKLPPEAAVLRSGKVLIAGGSRQAEMFDPVLGRFFTVPGDMTDSRHFMSETVLKDGRVLMAGGYFNDDLATAQTWMYQP